MEAASPDLDTIRRRRAKVFRVGLLIAALMGAFNAINGGVSLIDPTFGQSDPAARPQPTWISLVLLATGLVTLAALMPAWRKVRKAILAVIASRLASAWSAIALPFLPDAPDGIVFFAVLLIIVGTTVSVMVAQGLRS